MRHFVPALAALLVGSPVAAQDPIPLAPGQVHESVLDGAVMVYSVASPGGELVAARADQHGLDVQITVVAPDGSTVRRVDAPNGAWGPEAILFDAATAGTYRLEVRRADDASYAADGEEMHGHAEAASFSMRLLSRRAWSSSPDQRAQQLLNAWVDASEWEGAPGAVAAVVRGGEPIAFAAHGLANLELGVPLGPDTALDIGSVSKQFTDFAILLLAQRGRLGLDDDIREYLPEVPDFGTAITIRHLVHHMSGLREIYGSLALAGWQAGDGIAQSDALALVSRLKELNFEPGSEYLYCNTGYMLLADIVGRVSGKPFADFMEDEVFGPLGMARTEIMSEKGQVMWGAAESYDPRPHSGWSRVYDNSGIQGAGGIYTTIGDLARWLHNFDTGEVGGADVFRQMQQRGVLSNGDTLNYGFGINVTTARGVRTIAHGGSSAGYRASLTYLPDYDIGVVTQANSPAAVPRALVGMLLEAMLGDELEPLEPRALDEDARDDSEAEPSWTPSVAELVAFEGMYFSAELEAVYTLRVEEGVLQAWHVRHGVLDMTPSEEGVFTAPYPLVSVHMERDSFGRVSGFRATNGRVRNLLFERR